MKMTSATLLLLASVVLLGSVVTAVAVPLEVSLRADDAAGTSEPQVTNEPEPEASSEEVCVDARHLADVPAHHLVHAEHVLADAYCPLSSSLPCGTADHVIRLRDGPTVTYAQYCVDRECRRERMLVNSVLSHLWTDEEHDAGDVSLTMLDGRHPAVVQRTFHRTISLARRVARVFA